MSVKTPEKYRDRLLKAAFAMCESDDPNFAGYAFLAEVDAIMLELSEREDTILKLFRAVLDAESVTDRAEAERDARDFLNGTYAAKR